MNSQNRTKIKNYRDLEIWKLGKKIVFETYQMTKSFPKDEVFGITSQMRRAAVSIPSNIAEGFNRIHNKEYRQFLYIALGSSAELATQAELCHDLGYITQELEEKILADLIYEERMLRSLIKKL